MVEYMNHLYTFRDALLVWFLHTFYFFDPGRLFRICWSDIYPIESTRDNASFCDYAIKLSVLKSDQEDIYDEKTWVSIKISNRFYKSLMSI